MKDLSIVIPIYNEEEVLPILMKRIDSAFNSIDFSYELVFVNDGSQDSSLDRLLLYKNERSNITIVNLSRNFGHQAAITAGLEHSKSKSVVIIDADLQDPPELIPKLVNEWRKGFQVVDCIRTSRKESLIRKFLFNSFYKLFNMFIGDRIGIMSGVYGLMDRVVVDHLINLKEKNRFIPGLRNWIGFSKTSIMYERDERQAGKPQQSIINLFKYGFDAIFSFSYLPLRFSWIFGSFVSVMAFLLATVLIIFRVFNINVVLGFTTQAVLILFIGGIQLITIGIIGEYIGRIYDEVKQRPLYIIENIYKNDL